MGTSARHALRALALASLLAQGCSADDTRGPHGFEDDSHAEQAFPDEHGERHSETLTVGGYTDQFDYELLHGQKVFQSDIIIGSTAPEPETPADEPMAVPDDVANPPPADPAAEPGDDLSTTAEALAARAHSALWPNATVYYTIALDLPDRERVWDAIRHWQAFTPLRFVYRTTQRDYVTFRPGSGCSSAIGRQGGRQYVNLSLACSTGNVIHEIGHTVGLWHEQARTDRGDYVEIEWRNIRFSKLGNFMTYRQMLLRDGRNIGPYDYGSIMHYGSYAFSRNGRPTILRRDGGLIVAQRRGLSPRDVAGIWAIYRR